MELQGFAAPSAAKFVLLGQKMPQFTETSKTCMLIFQLLYGKITLKYDLYIKKHFGGDLQQADTYRLIPNNT